MSYRAERGFKYLTIAIATDSTNKRFPSADEMTANESAEGSGVCPAGSKVIIESITMLTNTTGTVTIGNGSSSAPADYFDIYIEGTSPVKLLGLEGSDGLGIEFVAADALSVALVAYTVKDGAS